MSGRDRRGWEGQDGGVSPLNIEELKQRAGEKPVHAVVTAQVQQVVTRTTKNGRPYLEMQLVDSGGGMGLKVWSDSEWYGEVAGMRAGEVVCFEGEWTQNAYGVEAKALVLRPAGEEEREVFFAGDPEIRRRQDQDYARIEELCGSLRDPRLRALCQRFLAQFGGRFRRTAAARKNHHARRGGLVEHVAQMMRAAEALCGVYGEWNRDLLLAGVLFHDCGKLWENSYPEEGFGQIHSLYGELLGHIPLGIEAVNRLWQDMVQQASPEEAQAWAAMEPTNESTRLHLLHLIGSHHGSHEFGSPVLPRTSEAHALHYIDNLDAKMEMVKDAYRVGAEAVPGIYERVFPLPANLVRPLPAWEGGISEVPAD